MNNKKANLGIVKSIHFIMLALLLLLLIVVVPFLISAFSVINSIITIGIITMVLAIFVFVLAYGYIMK